MSHWWKISSSYLVSIPNYWTWTRTTPQKKRFFWSNPYKIETMITSLIEMLTPIPHRTKTILCMKKASSIPPLAQSSKNHPFCSLPQIIPRGIQIQSFSFQLLSILISFNNSKNTGTNSSTKQTVQIRKLDSEMLS